MAHRGTPGTGTDAARDAQAPQAAAAPAAALRATAPDGHRAG